MGRTGKKQPLFGTGRSNTQQISLPVIFFVLVVGGGDYVWYFFFPRTIKTHELEPQHVLAINVCVVKWVQNEARE